MADDEIELRIHDRMECIIGQIWADCCLINSEMGYDRHNAEFEDLVSLSQQLIDLRTASAPVPKFVFEMGFMPYLYFVVINCRRLDLRLRALQHILFLAHDRENLFDARVMYNVGVRIVEMEHGIKLDPSWPVYHGAHAVPLPPDNVRIRSADITEDVEVRPDEAGRASAYRRVFFLIQPEAIVTGYTEWVKVVSPPRIVPLGIDPPNAALDQASNSGSSHRETSWT